MSKVIFIDKDKRKNAITSNDIVLILQAILLDTHSTLEFYNFTFENEQELFLEKSIELEISLISLDVYFFVYFDREYNDVQDIKKIYRDNRQYMRRVLNVKDYNIRSFRQLHQIREDLKIQYFDREQFAKIFDNSYIFILYLLFVDDFDIHRNMLKRLFCLCVKMN